MSTIGEASSFNLQTLPQARAETQRAREPTSSPAAAPTVSVTVSTAAPPPVVAHGSDFATVARDARATLDAGIETLDGKPGIYTTGAQWREVFGGMDRRSLFAVASNQDGRFSEVEQNAAAELMHKQLEAAMGVGTPRWASGDHASGFKNLVKFLENVSAEEKGSIGWATNRASAQQSYEIASRENGEEPEKLASADPLVQMIKAALEAAQGDAARERSQGRIDTIADLKNQPWAMGFEGRLDQAAADRARTGGLVDAMV